MRRCGCPTGDGPGDPVAGVSSAEVDVFSPDKKWGGLVHFVRSRLQKSEPDSLEKESGSHPAIRNAANATGSGYGYGNDIADFRGKGTHATLKMRDGLTLSLEQAETR